MILSTNLTKLIFFWGEILTNMFGPWDVFGDDHLIHLWGFPLHHDINPDIMNGICIHMYTYVVSPHGPFLSIYHILEYIVLFFPGQKK